MMTEEIKDICAAIGLLLLWMFDIVVNLAIPAIVVVGAILLLRHLFQT